MKTTNYKALLLDVGGTIVKPGQKKEISAPVIKAIKKANKYIDVSIVTGGPLYLANLCL